MRSKTAISTIIILVVAIVYIIYKQSEPTSAVSPSSSNISTTSLQDIQNSNVDSYSGLGISFSYDSSKASVMEKGDTIYVYPIDTKPEDGQRVTIFKKTTSETLEQSIRQQILAGNSSCNITVTQSNKYQGGYMQAEVTSSIGTTGSSTTSVCDPAYTKTNGVRFFLYDINHPDRFYFFDIGQNVIPVDGAEPWEDTVTIDS